MCLSLILNTMYCNGDSINRCSVTISFTCLYILQEYKELFTNEIIRSILTVGQNSACKIRYIYQILPLGHYSKSYF